MIIEIKEDGKFKVAIRLEKKEEFTVLLIDGENSQRVDNRMDYDTAKEIFDFILDNRTENVLNNIKILGEN